MLIHFDKLRFVVSYSHIKLVSSFKILTHFARFNYSSMCLPLFSHDEDYSLRAADKKQAVALQFILKSLTQAQR